MEPHATIAAWQGDRLTLWSKSQFVVNEQAEIAAIFGLSRENVQVICPFIGGAFGTSLRTWPHVTLAAFAARQVVRPVKLVLTRWQMFYTTGHRPRSIHRVALGATPDGKLTSLIHEGTGETSRFEEFVENLTLASSFLYSCPNTRTRYQLKPLDASTPTHMRGPAEASGVHLSNAPWTSWRWLCKWTRSSCVDAMTRPSTRPRGGLFPAGRSSIASISPPSVSAGRGAIPSRARCAMGAC